MCNAAPARAAWPRGMADCPEIKGLVWQGCTLYPQRPKQQRQQKQQQQRAFRGMAGRCGWAGHAVNPQTGPAAGGCAFGRLRSSASQAKRPHPWGLDGAIHGANGPAHPHRPASDRFPVTVATAGLLISSIPSISDRCSSTHGVDLLQIAGNCRRRGGSGCGGVSAMDGATEPPWTDSRRPPQPDPPRQSTGSQLLKLLRLLLWLLRVPGAARTTTIPFMLKFSNTSRRGRR